MPESVTQGVLIRKLQYPHCKDETLTNCVSIDRLDGAPLRVNKLDVPRSCTGVSQSSPNIWGTQVGNWRQKVWLGRTLSRHESVINLFLFSIQIKSKTRSRTFKTAGDPASDYQYDYCETESSYTLSPAGWLIGAGVRRGLRLKWLSSPMHGWKNTIETFRRVPEDALIFDFCRSGNLPAVQKLLSCGYASVRDTDSLGFTPLHVRLLLNIRYLSHALVWSGIALKAFRCRGSVCAKPEALSSNSAWNIPLANLS